MNDSTRVAVAFVATAGLAVLAAGCGGSSAAHVAQLGSTTTQSSSSSNISAADGAVSFSRCMRSHKVPAFPDPTTPGLLPKETPQQLGVSSSVLQAAQSACIHVVPNGGEPTPTQVAQYRSLMLVYARCIRAHGVPNMPDPDSRGHLDIGSGTDVDVNSSQFEAAYQACKSKLSP